jgi:DNA-binding NarL/FixJ family response regulator
MPRMNGIEAAKTIRKRFPNTIVIFLTQIADPDVKIAALANADAYVLKTQAPTELAATIRRTVRIHKGVAVAAQA